MEQLTILKASAPKYHMSPKGPFLQVIFAKQLNVTLLDYLRCRVQKSLLKLNL